MVQKGDSSELGTSDCDDFLLGAYGAPRRWKASAPLIVHVANSVQCHASRRQSRLAAHVYDDLRAGLPDRDMRASLSQLRLVLRSMRCRSLSRVRVSASCLAGDSCIEVRSEIVGMRLVCHDLEWHADRACHEKCTDCTTKSKAVRTAVLTVGRCSSPFAERAMQESVQGPRRLIQAFPGPSESESRKPNAFAPTASVQESRELSARAVGDELRRIVVLTIQKQARSPYHDAHAVAAGRCVNLQTAPKDLVPKGCCRGTRVRCRG